MTAKTSRTLAITIMVFMTLFTKVNAQDTIVKLINSEFTMEVHRDSAGVSVAVYLTTPANYSSIVIEKGQWSDGEFRQCADIDMKTQNANGGIITMKDNYPLNPFYDVYYRIKGTGIDGNEKIFPPLLLPAKTVPVPKFHL